MQSIERGVELKINPSNAYDLSLKPIPPTHKKCHRTLKESDE